MKLFEEFLPANAQQWENQILKDLKLQSINALLWHTEEGIALRPFYTSENTNKTYPVSYSLPFEIVQYIPQPHKASEKNKMIIEALNGGASGIYLECFEKDDISAIMDNVSLLHIYSNIQLSFDTLYILDELSEIIFQKNPYTKKHNCFVNIDPIYLFEKYGRWHISYEKDFEALLHTPYVSINASLYKESGGNIIQELSYTLAHLNEYLLYIEKQHHLKNIEAIHFTISIGHSFFREIAKLRALRHLVNAVCKEYNISPSIHIHAQTALMNKSYMDIYNNLVRTSLESASAIFGGADSIHVFPFDFPFKKASDFSMRLSRNQLLLHKYESYFDKVADVASGSYFIEHLTEEYLEKAYQKFIDIEKEGGMVALLESGKLKSELKHSWDLFIEKMNKNEFVLIGVNQFSNPKDEPVLKNYYDYNLSDYLHCKRWAEKFERTILV